MGTIDSHIENSQSLRWMGTAAPETLKPMENQYPWQPEGPVRSAGTFDVKVSAHSHHTQKKENSLSLNQ